MILARQATTVIAAMGCAASVVVAQRHATPADPAAALTVNTTIGDGFDLDADLRNAQAETNPTRRIEILARPGDTQVEAVSNGHRAQVDLHVIRLPTGLSGEAWPATTLIGSYDSSAPYAVTEVTIRVDGCVVDLPRPFPVFSDPRIVTLGRDRAQWTLGISGSESAEDYAADYGFDAKTVLSQKIDYGGDYDAVFHTSANDYAAGRDCKPLQPRHHGSRAELKANPPRPAVIRP